MPNLTSKILQEINPIDHYQVLKSGFASSRKVSQVSYGLDSIRQKWCFMTVEEKMWVVINPVLTLLSELIAGFQARDLLHGALDMICSHKETAANYLNIAGEYMPPLELGTQELSSTISYKLLADARIDEQGDSVAGIYADLYINGHKSDKGGLLLIKKDDIVDFFKEPCFVLSEFQGTLTQSYQRLQNADKQQRIAAFHDTLSFLADVDENQNLKVRANANLRMWKGSAEHAKRQPDQQIEVINGDWAEVTQSVTHEYGEAYGVLNMANPIFPGGSGLETGSPAMEENMFTRTNCAVEADYGTLGNKNLFGHRRYTPAMSELIQAQNGQVYLSDTTRVCFKDTEAKGFARLSNWNIFPFYEMRAAALNLRKHGNPNSHQTRTETTRRIRAQLDTFKEAGVAHVVLGAFGCGSFGGNPQVVASIYKELLSAPEYADFFKHVVFAIYTPPAQANAGQRADNFTVFQNVFSNEIMDEVSSEQDSEEGVSDDGYWNDAGSNSDVSIIVDDAQSEEASENPGNKGTIDGEKQPASPFLAEDGEAHEGSADAST